MFMLVSSLSTDDSDLAITRKSNANSSTGRNHRPAKHDQNERRKVSCSLCNQGHHLFRCDQFKAMSGADRLVHVKKCNLCFNCLRSGHKTSDCTHANRCIVCQKRRSAFLHSVVESDSSAATNIESSFMPVVRVKVNEEFWVSVALDT